MRRHPGPTSSLLTPDRTSPAAPEECLVADARAGLTPAQLVERKLVSLLKSDPLPVSHVQAGREPLRRGKP